jgi:hypothetical protein
MNWKFDDSEMPPFVVELTDESTDAECMVDEMTEAAIDRIVDKSWPEGETLTEETIREMILWGMVYGWQFAQQTGGAEQTIANRMAAAKRREKKWAFHEPPPTARCMDDRRQIADQRHHEAAAVSPRPSWEKARAFAA